MIALWQSSYKNIIANLVMNAWISAYLRLRPFLPEECGIYFAINFNMQCMLVSSISSRTWVLFVQEISSINCATQDDRKCNSSHGPLSPSHFSTRITAILLVSSSRYCRLNLRLVGPQFLCLDSREFGLFERKRRLWVNSQRNHRHI